MRSGKKRVSSNEESSRGRQWVRAVASQWMEQRRTNGWDAAVPFCLGVNYSLVWISTNLSPCQFNHPSGKGKIGSSVEKKIRDEMRRKHKGRTENEIWWHNSEQQETRVAYFSVSQNWVISKPICQSDVYKMLPNRGPSINNIPISKLVADLQCLIITSQP